jgi:carboxylesterase
MNKTRWSDWYGEIERSFDDLRGRCDTVFAMGLSMGGTLVLRLAEERGQQVAGLVLVNASVASQDKRLALLPVLKHFVPAFPGIASDIKNPDAEELAYEKVPLKALASLRGAWKTVHADLGRITCPVLVYRSTEDHVVEPLSAELLLAGIRTPTEERILENSYHVATLDNDAPEIFAGSLDFVRAHAPAAAG